MTAEGDLSKDLSRIVRKYLDAGTDPHVIEAVLCDLYQDAFYRAHPGGEMWIEQNANACAPPSCACGLPRGHGGAHQ